MDFGALKIGMLDELPELETQCTQCFGRGGHNDIEDDGWAECPYCKGSGFKPTLIGLRILDLVRHNSRVKFNAELCVSTAALGRLGLSDTLPLCGRSPPSAQTAPSW